MTVEVDAAVTRELPTQEMLSQPEVAGREPMKPAPFRDVGTALLLAGHVTSVFGSPVEAAIVEIDGCQTAITGAQGLFRVSTQGARRLSVVAAGYVRRDVELDNAALTGIVELGAVQLMGLASLAVRVSDPSGKPIPKVHIRVARRSKMQERHFDANRAQDSLDGKTDADGLAVFDGIPAGCEFVIKTLHGDLGIGAATRVTTVQGVNVVHFSLPTCRRLTLKGVAPAGPTRQRFFVLPIDLSGADAWQYESAAEEESVSFMLPPGRYVVGAEGACAHGQQRELIELSADREVIFSWGLALTVLIRAVNEAGVPIARFSASARLIDTQDSDYSNDVSFAITARRGEAGRDGVATVSLVGDPSAYSAQSSLVSVTASAPEYFSVVKRVRWDATRTKIEVDVVLKPRAHLTARVAGIAPGTCVSLWLKDAPSVGSLRGMLIRAASGVINRDQVAELLPPFEGAYDIHVEHTAAALGETFPAGGLPNRYGWLGETHIAGSGPWTFNAETVVGAIQVEDTDADGGAVPDCPAVYFVRSTRGLGAGDYRERRAEPGMRANRAWRFEGLTRGQYVVLRREDVSEPWSALNDHDGVRATVTPGKVSRVSLPRARKSSVCWELAGPGAGHALEWSLIPVRQGATYSQNIQWQALPSDRRLQSFADPAAPVVLVLRRMWPRFAPRFSRPLFDVVFAMRFATAKDLAESVIHVPEPAMVRVQLSKASRVASARVASVAAASVLIDAGSEFDPWTGEAEVAPGPSRIELSSAPDETGSVWHASFDRDLSTRTNLIEVTWR